MKKENILFGTGECRTVVNIFLGGRRTKSRDKNVVWATL
jgi:hypothetical protein